jgi:hypothetical protein
MESLRYSSGGGSKGVRGGGREGYVGDGVKSRGRERERERERERDCNEMRKRRRLRDDEREREKERRRSRERPVSTGVCMMGEAPPRLEFPLGLVLAI